MGHLQKTPIGLARRILNFNEESVQSGLGAPETGNKPAITATYPIQTIMEANEASITAVVVPAARARTIGEKTPQPAKPAKPAGPVGSTIATAAAKPKTWKVGKASKNAVNSEVQSLGKVTTPRVSPAQLQSTQQQSWAQRVQSLPKFDLSQPQSKSKLNNTKSESAKTTSRSTPSTQRLTHSASSTLSTSTAPSSNPMQSELEDGWETVRGRTRSRTSPAKVATKVQPGLVRASTVIYTSRLEASKQQQGSSLQQKRRSKLLKPATAQSLPSLCDRVEEKKEMVQPPLPPPIIIEPTPPPLPSPLPPAAPTSRQPAVVLELIEPLPSTDDGEETDEAGQVEAEEEAEMARREEALTAEEEHLQREIRETERSDNEADELWEDPINVTPVI